MSLIKQASNPTEKSDLLRWIRRGLTIGVVTLKVNLLLGASTVLLVVSGLVTTGGSQAQEGPGHRGIGTPSVFQRKYLSFRAQQLNRATPDVMRIRLGSVKGLTRSFTGTVGAFAVNLDSGAFDVTLRGLIPLETYTVWLVDRAESNASRDTAFGLVTFTASGISARLTGALPRNLPTGLTIDRVMVAPGTARDNKPLGAGMVNVFQKIFFRRLSLVNQSTGKILFKETKKAPRLSALVPRVAAETEAVLALASPKSNPFELAFATILYAQEGTVAVPVDRLISQGARLFFDERFDGNGRTCGTCHPASNNFTIDPAFIAMLPDSDPLFVAEHNPALAALERPDLMRGFGLILENLDGFDNPPSNPPSRFVMRGVPHTLGLTVSLDQDPGLTDPPTEMTGWSGDGAPGTGSLREFAIGAVIQHFTRNLERVEIRDFRLPAEPQLDAMEAFQLSLGRAADFVLTSVTFNDANVAAGQSLFINGTGDPNAGGQCAACHNNAGALAAFNGKNVNFNTNVEDKEHPARTEIEPFPIDGGFGRTPVNPDGGFGNRTFNTPPVVEAADTAPFFHNNVVATLEGVMDFYTGSEFNNPDRPLSARFSFTQVQKDQIAGFMRAINTLQNIDVARRELEEILAIIGNPQQEQNRRLQTALDDTQDAIDVLTGGIIFPSAVPHLTAARTRIEEAQQSSVSSQRRTLVQQAIAELVAARSVID
jgi:cytochrome c peroxidase